VISQHVGVLHDIPNLGRSELNLTHYCTLIRIEDEHGRECYAKEAVAKNWSSRALERQVSRLYYERQAAALPGWIP